MEDAHKGLVYLGSESAKTAVGLLGFPYGPGSSVGKPGSKFGPARIREALSWDLNRIENDVIYDVEARRVVDLSGVEFKDFGDVFISGHDHMANLARAKERILEIFAQGFFPIVIGGDHAISHSVLQALHESDDTGRLGIIHFDAHPDLVDENPRQGKWSHSSPIRRALELDRFAPQNVVQIGLRGFSYPEVFSYAEANGILQFTAADVFELGVPAVAERTLERACAGDARVCLTVDMDVLDPAFGPGVGAPDAGGLTSAQLIQFIRLFAAELDVMDINEVNPLVDHFDVTSSLAAHLVMMTVCQRAMADQTGVVGRSAQSGRVQESLD